MSISTNVEPTDLTSYPLVVDLDGTLIFTDMLHESAIRVVRDKPLHTLQIPYWLYQGKAILKKNLSAGTVFDATSLPYNKKLIDWLKQQKTQGRTLVLCTASDIRFATAIAAHLGIFSEVLASDGKLNLAGKAKADLLSRNFGLNGFDYVGNSRADLAVWQVARRAVVVNAPPSLVKKAGLYCKVEQIFTSLPLDLTAWGRVLRVHQWLKNLLLFVPIFAAHQLTDLDIWFSLILAFLSFSLCASSVYIVNDLLDLESDRQHPRKRNRPFASGLVPAWMGVGLAPLLWLFSIVLAQYVGGTFFTWLIVYFAVTCAYSWGLKRVMLVDCLTLAVLYTLRIVAGAAAAGLAMSFWLLAFSVFLFLSLAFVKRYAELQVQMQRADEKVHGRGYFTSDAPLVQMLGVNSGFAAVIVLALYLNSDAVTRLYRTPELIWGAVPVMLFWVSWIWMQAHRGQMHDDPLIFAIKDKGSLAAGAAFATVLVVGTIGWSW